jgi:hypothetical protein
VFGKRDDHPELLGVEEDAVREEVGAEAGAEVVVDQQEGNFGLGRVAVARGLHPCEG